MAVNDDPATVSDAGEVTGTDSHVYNGSVSVFAEPETYTVKDPETGDDVDRTRFNRVVITDRVDPGDYVVDNGAYEEAP